MRLIRFIVLCALVLPAPVAHAWSYGVINTTQRPGDSGNGCASCHGSVPGVVDVRVEGSSAVLPGASARYAVIIDAIGNAMARGGFTAAITRDSAGQPVFTNVPGEPTATADSGTQIVNNNSSVPLRLPDNGRVTYLIDLSVPAGITLGNEYTIHAVGDAGHGTNQVGWSFASPVTIAIGPPAPDALSADQENASTTEIALAWTGSSQGEHFRVLRKTGGYAESPGDASAELVYEGPDASATAIGLTPGTQYFFSAWGKVPDEAFYSGDSARADAASLPDNPGSLTIHPVSGSEIVLDWSGNSSAYRLLRKVGEFPSSPEDGDATLVFEGDGSTANDSGLSSHLAYHYRIWSQVPGMDVFSAQSAQAVWIESIHRDRFETWR
ncbi:choice-of-anchor V domain-containing protein [Wenzhouxiangella sp. EGI_FJ10409]|uniref:choice-of-anchor V domain-containing protein n=1 Tax=Wenzhouxiangella sp. EGI_FJ10409 TaxID=3243767 RepID=UPI0035D701D4